MIKEIKQLMQEVVDYLGLDLIPLEFDEISDDSRLITKPHLKLVINSKFENNYVECAKSITHELRHLFQITYVALMNDERAARWKEELSSAKTGNEVGYVMQELELDAFAFTENCLKEKYGIEVKYPNDEYQKLIDLYIVRWREIL